jgi:hypothetical protein
MTRHWLMILLAPVAPFLMGATGCMKTFTVSISNPSVSVAQAGTGTVTVAVASTDGFTAPVALTATGLPSGVTASFSPSLVPIGSSSILTLTASASAVIGKTPIKITGQAETQTVTGALEVNVTGPGPTPGGDITVSGKVFDETLQPVPGVPVKIGTASVNTDSDGKFTIPNVKTPYDAIVVINAVQQGYVFKGLTRADPTLQVFEYKGTLKMAQVQGNLTGGAALAATNPADTYTKIFFGSPEAYNGVYRLNPTDPATYGPFNQYWSNTPATTGKVYALEYKVNAKSLPIDYTGFGFTDAVLSTSSPLSTVKVDMSEGVNDETLTGTVSLPAKYNLNWRQMYVKPSSDGGTQVVNESPMNNSPFSYTTPSRSSVGLSAVTITVAAEALTTNVTGGTDTVDVWKTGLAPDAKSVILTMPQVPSQVLPAKDALGVTTATPFSFSGQPGAVQVVTFQPLAAGNPIYYVVTSGSNAQIPNLTDLGLGLPASTQYDWFVKGFAPYGSTDVASGPKGFATDSRRLQLDHPGPSADGWYAITDYRRFTTAP